MTKAKDLLPISDAEEARIQAGNARDPDNPELTEEEFAMMRPSREVLPPELFAAWTKARQKTIEAEASSDMEAPPAPRSRHAP
jgi:uncharacterized protein (DUF4415 family)